MQFSTSAPQRGALLKGDDIAWRWSPLKGNVWLRFWLHLSCKLSILYLFFLLMLKMVLQSLFIVEMIMTFIFRLLMYSCNSILNFFWMKSTFKHGLNLAWILWQRRCTFYQILIQYLDAPILDRYALQSSVISSDWTGPFNLYLRFAKWEHFDVTWLAFYRSLFYRIRGHKRFKSNRICVV